MSPNDLNALRERAERAAARGGVVAVEGATLLCLLDGYAAPVAAPHPPTGDARELVYHALVGLTDPQATLRKLSAGRVVMVSDGVWDKVTAALNALAKR